MYRHFLSKVAVVQEGLEPLPHCNLCVIHMPAGQIIRHKRTACSEKNTQMRWHRRDAMIKSMCSEAKFSLTGEEEAEHIEEVEVFKYLVRMLDRSDNDWPSVIHNIRKARQVWGRLWNLLQREGL